jgi:hypothetical protein
LTFADIVEEIRRRSRAATGDRATIAAERLHQNAANWYCRPVAAGGDDEEQTLTRE